MIVCLSIYHGCKYIDSIYIYGAMGHHACHGDGIGSVMSHGAIKAVIINLLFMFI
jgi:hypothetical protein